MTEHRTSVFASRSTDTRGTAMIEIETCDCGGELNTSVDAGLFECANCGRQREEPPMVWLREAPAETGTKTCGTCGTVEEFECTDGWTKISVAVCGKCVSDGANGITTLDSEIDCTCDHCIKAEFINGHIEKGHHGGTRAECPGCMAKCHCGPLLAPWKCVRCDMRERKA